MTDFIIRAMVGDQLKSLYTPPAPLPKFANLIEKIDREKAKIVPMKRKSVWWLGGCHD